ncbi:MAG: EVE domain-containing protein [Elusimicrobia bacterium]|nr:EVE domain-containing protein [Elusimicrobiota bacterium]
MTAWIFSTEPGVYPWSRVEADGRARWDGIRGPLARRWLREIAVGDTIWGYHTSPEKTLVCLARAAAAAVPDPADEKWLAIDVSFERWLQRPVPLAEMRASPALSEMPFLRIPRLSVAPVTPLQERALKSLAGEMKKQ